MLEFMELQKIVAEEETYTLHIVVPKSLWHNYQQAFEGIMGIAKDLHYKTRIAEMRSEAAREKNREEVRQRNDGVLADIRQCYQLCLDKGLSQKAALKVVNKEFKQWWFLRPKFKAELDARRDLEIGRLKKKGLADKQIAAQMNISPSTVYKVLKEVKEG